MNIYVHKGKREKVMSHLREIERLKKLREMRTDKAIQTIRIDHLRQELGEMVEQGLIAFL